MASEQKRTRQASRPSEEWSSGHTLNEWADYLDMTRAEAIEKFKRWEGRGWCEVAWADNGQIFLRVTQRGVEIADRITGTTPLSLH